MSRISIPAVESAAGVTADMYAQVKKNPGGRVPNTFAALGQPAPTSLAALLIAEGTLTSGCLSQQELQTIKLLVSAKTGSDVCVAARSFEGRMVGLSVNAPRGIRAGQATGDAKRDALVRFVSHLKTTSDTISQEEFTAIRAAGYSDTQLPEISQVIALTIFSNTFGAPAI